MLVEKNLSFAYVEVDGEEEPAVLASHILHQLKLGVSRYSSLADQPVLGASAAEEVVLLIIELDLLL